MANAARWQNILRGVHILLVDDDPDAREVLTVALQYCGAVVNAAGSAREALQSLQRLTPDIILSDIAMPGEDGYWLLEQVRKLSPDRGGRLPVLAVTGHGREHGPDRTRRAGFNAHVNKPVDPWKLCDAVAGLVTRE